MADGTTLDPGTGGDTIATEDIGGVKYQMVKLISGADDATDRIGGDATNGLDVDVTRSALPTGAATSAKQDTVIGHLDGVEGILTTIDGDTGTISTNTTTLAGAVSGTEMQVDVVTSALPTGAATSALQTTGNTALSGIQTAVEILDNAISGSEMQVDVVAALPAGDNNIGNVDLASAIPAGNNNIGDVDVASIAAGTNTIGNVGVVPRTSGGCSIFRSLDLDETEEAVKAGAGQVFGWYMSNSAATSSFVKFYNATTANVTVGSTTPLLTFEVPAGAAANMSLPMGIAFDTAITVAATTGVADADNTGPGANEVVVNIFYA